METYECSFPFKRKKMISVDELVLQNGMSKKQVEQSIEWLVGCGISNKPGFLDYGDQIFICDGIGKKFLNLIEIIEMPGRLHNRVIYQSWYQDPSGHNTEKRVKMCTVTVWRRLMNGFYNKLEIYNNGDSGKRWIPDECKLVK